MICADGAKNTSSKWFCCCSRLRDTIMIRIRTYNHVQYLVYLKNYSCEIEVFRRNSSLRAAWLCDNFKKGVLRVFFDLHPSFSFFSCVFFLLLFSFSLRACVRACRTNSWTRSWPGWRSARSRTRRRPSRGPGNRWWRTSGATTDSTSTPTRTARENRRDGKTGVNQVQYLGMAFVGTFFHGSIITSPRESGWPILPYPHSL